MNAEQNVTSKGPWYIIGRDGYLCVDQDGSGVYFGIKTLEDAEAKRDELNAAERVRDAAPDLLAACKPVVAEALQRCNFMEPDWNPEAHVELTLTIAECRAIQRAIALAEPTDH